MTPSSQQLQPLTSKELDYITDCLSNENSLAKHCAAAASSIQKPAVQQTLMGLVSRHESHIGTLLQSLESHQAIAPSQAH